MKDPCDLATIFAEKLMKAQDLDELGRICGEIKARLHDLGDMRPWLLDIYDSAYKGLTMKEFPDSEFLNAEGLKNKEVV
jgi:hypothetical protein